LLLLPFLLLPSKRELSRELSFSCDTWPPKLDQKFPQSFSFETHLVPLRSLRLDCPSKRRLRSTWSLSSSSSSMFSIIEIEFVLVDLIEKNLLANKLIVAKDQQRL
jgi:hypothetical protein